MTKTPEWPNLPLNSDLAVILFRSLSSFRFLGSAQGLGAGGAGSRQSLTLIGVHQLLSVFIGVPSFRSNAE